VGKGSPGEGGGEEVVRLADANKDDALGQFGNPEADGRPNEGGVRIRILKWLVQDGSDACKPRFRQLLSFPWGNFGDVVGRAGCRPKAKQRGVTVWLAKAGLVQIGVSNGKTLQGGEAGRRAGRRQLGHFDRQTANPTVADATHRYIQSRAAGGIRPRRKWISVESDSVGDSLEWLRGEGDGRASIGAWFLRGTQDHPSQLGDRRGEVGFAGARLLLLG
jgi:hypothetical protein